MARTMRSHKGTFYVKAKSKNHLSTDGNQYAIWAKLIPSNMIISKYWITATIRSEDTVDDQYLSPMDFNLSGFLSNIPVTGSRVGDEGGGAEVSHIDSSDTLGTTLDQLGVFPTTTNPHIAESGEDIDLPGGFVFDRYWQDRRFFERPKSLSFPKDAIMVGSNSYRYYDQFSTNGTRLGQNSDYKQPRMLSFIWSADNQLTTNLYTNSQMITGSASTNYDIDIAEWDRQAQSAMDPTFVILNWDANDPGNPYLETIGDLDTGSIGNDAAGNSSGNLALMDETSSSTAWSVNRWMKYGQHDDNSDITQDVNIDFFIDLDVTLQCQMYTPGHKMVVTTP